MSEKQNITEVTDEMKAPEDTGVKKVLKSKKLNSILKNFGGFLVGLFVGLMFMGLGAMSLVDENNRLTNENNSLTSSNDRLSSELSEAKPWFDMKDEEKRKIEEQNAKVAEEKKLEEEKKNEEERIAKEEKAKNKYNTELTYDEIARNPEQTLLKNCKFTGEVVQVLEGEGNNNLRVAINDDYDKMMLVEYSPSILKSRILEKDSVTIYGTSAGTTSYTSTMGAKITIPAMVADKIDIN